MGLRDQINKFGAYLSTVCNKLLSRWYGKKANRAGNVTRTGCRWQAGQECRTVRSHDQPVITNHQDAAIVSVTNQAPHPLLKRDHSIRELDFVKRIAAAQPAVFHTRF
ncbi:hypothetical protein D3C81_1869090 [compost metagenome]